MVTRHVVRLLITASSGHNWKEYFIFNKIWKIVECKISKDTDRYFFRSPTTHTLVDISYLFTIHQQ